MKNKMDLGELIGTQHFIDWFVQDPEMGKRLEFLLFFNFNDDLLTHVEFKNIITTMDFNDNEFWMFDSHCAELIIKGLEPSAAMAQTCADFAEKNKKIIAKHTLKKKLNEL